MGMWLSQDVVCLVGLKNDYLICKNELTLV